MKTLVGIVVGWVLGFLTLNLAFLSESLGIDRAAEQIYLRVRKRLRKLFLLDRSFKPGDKVHYLNSGVEWIVMGKADSGVKGMWDICAPNRDRVDAETKELVKFSRLM